MTAKLILTRDGAILREYLIDKDSLSIGRKPDNDIQLDDKTVSGRHALITTVGGETFVEDLGSTNGTLVDGSHISKFLLMHGDIIQVGTHQFTYFCEEKAAYEPTMFLKSAVAETEYIPLEGDTPPVKGDPLGAAKLLNGPSANTIMEMRKPYNTLGYNGITLAVIARTAEGYTISALKGAKGRRATDVPLLNGRPLDGGARQLKEHDIIEIAGFQMEFIFLH